MSEAFALILVLLVIFTEQFVEATVDKIRILIKTMRSGQEPMADFAPGVVATDRGDNDGRERRQELESNPADADEASNLAAAETGRAATKDQLVPGA